MSAIRNLAILLVLLAAVSLVVLPVAARHGDDEDLTTKHDDAKIIIDDDGETYVCRIQHGKRIHVVRQKDGEEIVDLDLAELHESIEEALDGVHEALSEIENINISVDWDDDGILELDIDEAHMSFDIDEIMEDAFDAVAMIGEITLDELDLDDLHINWDDDGDHRHRIIINGDDDEDEVSSKMQEELQSLRDEVKRLQDELKKVERRQRH